MFRCSNSIVTFSNATYVAGTEIGTQAQAVLPLIDATIPKRHTLIEREDQARKLPTGKACSRYKAKYFEPIVIRLYEISLATMLITYPGCNGGEEF